MGSRSLAVVQGRLDSALHHARKTRMQLKEHKVEGIGPLLAATGVGIVSGVASSMAVGAIPVPEKMGKYAPAIKSGVQTGAGLAAALLFKNKWIRFAGLGAATLGGADLLRRLSPVHIPTMAGEADEMIYGERDGGRDLNEYELQALRAMAGEPLGEPLGGEPLNGDETRGGYLRAGGGPG